MLEQLIKRNLSKLLCNDISGSLLLMAFPQRIPDIRRKGFKFFLEKETTQKKDIASIFWGLYETKEIRFIDQYFKGVSDVVELGSGQGIVSAHLLSRMKEDKMIVLVEADLRLIEVLKKNIKQYQNNNIRTALYNKAVSYYSNEVALEFTGVYTGTTVKEVTRESKCIVQAITLNEIVSDHQLKDYTLVCDIEGVEIDIIMNDGSCLEKCREIFIEFHDTTYLGTKVTVKDMAELMKTKHHFKQVASRGRVYFFSKDPIYDGL